MTFQKHERFAHTAVCPIADTHDGRTLSGDTALVGNRIVDAMEERGFDILAPHLARRNFGIGETVYEPLALMTHVYFPIDCVLSMITTMNDGDEIEVGTIGCEGCSASEALLGADRSSTHVVSQVPGEALAMPFETFLRFVASDGTFRMLNERYARYLMALMSQSIACNRLHPLLERTARWLLTTCDRTKGDTFRLTQEYMAVLLGVHRQAVSIAASTLQQADYIAYSRGSITIKDRAGLESASCECYEATKVALARLCPPLNRDKAVLR